MVLFILLDNGLQEFMKISRIFTKCEKLQIKQAMFGPMYLLFVLVGISLSLSQSIQYSYFTHIRVPDAHTHDFNEYLQVLCEYLASISYLQAVIHSYQFLDYTN